MSSAAPPASPCPFSTDSLAREPSRFAQAVQRVENCLAGMQRINEQIGSLAEQRRKLQDELRGIQCQINEEFERILKPARPATKVVSRAISSGAAAPAGGTTTAEHPQKSSGPPSLRMEPSARLPELDRCDDTILARAAS